MGRTRLLFHCFAGCPASAVLEALADAGLLVPAAPGPAAIEQSRARACSTGLAASRLWRSSRPIAGTKAEAYLASRGLSHESAALRFHPRTPFGAQPQTVFAPALVAAVHDGSDLVAVHRTRLDPPGSGSGETGPRKAALGPLASGAVRLAPPRGELGLAEGIETALAATALTGVPCWATLGAARFGRIALPAGLSRLILFLDNDRGGREGERLARKAHAPHLPIEVRRPGRPGADWNDVLLAYQGSADGERGGGG